MRGLIGCLPTMVIFLCQASIAQEQPAARILSVSGKIAVTSGDKEHAAEIYGGLFDGDKLSFAAKSAIVLAWPEANRVERWTATGDTEVRATVGAKGLDAATGLKVVRFPRKLDASVFEGLPSVSPGAVTIMRGAFDPHKPRIEPIADSTIPSDRADFSWPAAADATRYELLLKRGADQVWKTDTDKTTASMPSSKTLTRGESYDWKVTAIKNDGTKVTVAKGTFSVATEEELAEAEELKRLASSLKEEEPDRLPVLVLMASRYENLNMFSEATRVYEQLAKLSPESAVHHAALFELYQRAGRSTDAEKSRKAAEELGFKFKKANEAGNSRDDQ